MALLGRAYPSPTMVLLAWDWPDGAGRKDFLGFSIERTPGFRATHGAPPAASSFLTNRLTFKGPPANGQFVSSEQFPIQKFYWWDARYEDADRGSTFSYTIRAMQGPATNVRPYADVPALVVKVTLPHIVENGVGTYFNRAVVSSQSFVSNFGHFPTGAKLQQALEWLSNGLEHAIPDFVKASAGDEIEGAIYHLTDTKLGTLPALESFKGRLSLVFDAVPHTEPKTKQPIPNPNSSAVAALGTANHHFEGHPRVHTTIMHDKFLVRVKGNAASALLAGSANFTTEGLSSQANLLHTFENPALAELYRARQELLAPDPAHTAVTAKAAWSKQVSLQDGGKVRAFYPPEPGGKTKAAAKTKPTSKVMTTIVDAISKATHSAVFCLFTPTDPDMLNAFFKLVDQRKMMFGLINSIPQKDPATAAHPQKGLMLIYDRAKRAKKVDLVGHAQFGQNAPTGFWHEDASLTPPGKGKAGANQGPPVFVHHKFIVIDGETDHPVIYTGSANMSNNSSFNNDENIMEISGSTRLAETYLAEFMRLFEHYRARFSFVQRTGSPTGKMPKRPKDASSFTLTADASWDKDWYTAGSSKSNSRIALAQDAKTNGTQTVTPAGVRSRGRRGAGAVKRKKKP